MLSTFHDQKESRAHHNHVRWIPRPYLADTDTIPEWYFGGYPWNEPATKIGPLRYPLRNPLRTTERSSAIHHIQILIDTETIPMRYWGETNAIPQWYPGGHLKKWTRLSSRLQDADDCAIQSLRAAAPAQEFVEEGPIRSREAAECGARRAAGLSTTEGAQIFPRGSIRRDVYLQSAREARRFTSDRLPPREFVARSAFRDAAQLCCCNVFGSVW
jgi:hypothetical protein